MTKLPVSGAKALRAFLLCSAIAGMAHPALAQETPQGAQEERGGDIVVTALKRGTRIQETPISISAITSETLTNSGVKSISDLASVSPGLSVATAGPADRRVVIRGIQAAGEPTVGIYFDEVAITGAVGGQADAGRNTPEMNLFDVERVEVLRGPQGTLYGGGSMGGTLRIIYKKPVFETEGAVDTSISTTQDGGINYEANGVVNIPIVSDKIAFRAVGFYRNNNGFIDNTYLDIKNVNDEESYGGRAMLRLMPVERLTIDLAAFYNKGTTTSPVWIREAGKYNTDNPTLLPVRDRVDLYSATAVYDFGGVTATAVASYMDRRYFNSTDTTVFSAGLRNEASYNRFCVTGAAAGRCTNPNYLLPGAGGVPAGGITNLDQYLAYVDAQTPSSIYSDTDANQFTGEFRLSSSGSGPVNWTAGAYYSRRKIDGLIAQVANDVDTGYFTQPLQYFTRRTSDDVLKHYAGFADVSWDITPELNVAGGVRFFRYERSVLNETTVPSVLAGAVVTPPTRISATENGKVFRANVSYKITPDVMLYAQAAQGFRPGGVNNVIGLPQDLAPYQSDKLWNYEAGIKTSLFDRLVTLNLDGFWIDWSDIQITARTTNGVFSFVTNAGAARVKGIEADTTITPFKGLTLQANASYVDAKLSENQTNAQVTAAGLKGDRIPFVPRYSAAASVQYTAPVNSMLNALLRADYTYTGGSRSDFRPYVNSPTAPSRFTRDIDAFSQVNIRVGIETQEPGWGVYFYATNLFGATGITRASSGLVQAGQTYVGSIRPQTFGINMRGAF